MIGPMSKILMVQMKSELGKGWTHCTDVTPNELTQVSFRACSEDERNPLTNGGFQDGASFRGVEHVDYEMLDSYQAHFNCMDMTELEDYIESQVPIDFSDSHVSEMLESIRPEISQ